MTTVGDRLPSAAYVMDTTRIVAGALASRDFMPVHHDKAYAIDHGSPDVFMNIMSTNGYCSRYLTDWAGPDAMLRSLSIRLGVPVYPGTTLRFEGEIIAVDQQPGEQVVEVSFTASTEHGDHATGSASLSILADS